MFGLRCLHHDSRMAEPMLSKLSMRQNHETLCFTLKSTNRRALFSTVEITKLMFKWLMLTMSLYVNIYCEPLFWTDEDRSDVIISVLWRGWPIFWVLKCPQFFVLKCKNISWHGHNKIRKVKRIHNLRPNNWPNNFGLYKMWVKRKIEKSPQS